MNYCIEKTVEYRLRDAARVHRNADLARQARTLRQADRSELLRSLRCRLANWTPLRTCVDTRDGVPTSSATANGRFSW